METRQILAFAVEVGECMLIYGGEVYRVEDTIVHILKSLDVTDYDVYVLSNGIFASAHENLEDSCSIVRHVNKGNVRLDIIDALNTLSRDLWNKKISFEKAKEILHEIKNLPEHPHYILILASGIGSLGFTYLFGGNFFDCFISLCIGSLLQFFLLHTYASKFIKNIFGSFIVTFCALCVNELSHVHMNQIIIGCIMLLVPGIAITTSIRDLFAGDYLSGTIHLLDAMLTALCIAVGVGSMMLMRS